MFFSQSEIKPQKTQPMDNIVKTGNNIVSIYSEMTPNPDTLKFVANKLLFPQDSVEFTSEETAKQLSPLAFELFSFPFVKGVFIASNFVTITKDKATEWNDVMGTIRDFLKDYLESGKEVIDVERVEADRAERANSQVDEGEIVPKIKEILENYVKPAVEMDGGAIQFKSFEDGVVTLILQGACSGCPSSTITLKAGIEGMMKRLIPEVREVVAEDELV